MARGAARGRAEVGRRLLREVEGIFGAVAALFLVASFLSYEADNAAGNFCGPVGYVTADILAPALGLAVYLVPLYLGVLTWQLFSEDGPAIPVAKAVGCGVLVLTVSTTFAIVQESSAAGGWLGGFIAGELAAFVGTFGAVIITGALFLLSLQLLTEASLPSILRALGGRGVDLARSTAERARALWAGLKSRRASAAAEKASSSPDLIRQEAAPPPVVLTAPVVEVPPDRDATDPSSTGEKRRSRRQAKKEVQAELPFHSSGKYRVPPLSLLDTPVTSSSLRVDEEALIASSRILENKLGDFGVEGKVVAVQPGPVITTFEFEPAPGVKVNRIVTLADDLSMALRALSVRILAPIPGKPVVGIEVSNPRREKVFIREILESEAFRNTNSLLALGLGKDPTGRPFVADLGRMPHLLIAGATGTGKSVSINAMLLSVLFRSSPRDVRFIMIDPKMLELSIYEDIPHLLVPVVTDPKRATVVLANVIREMQYRYRLMHAKGVRNVDNYNRSLERQQTQGKEGVIDLQDAVEDGPPEPPPALRPDDAPLVHQHLSHIVIIIDEFADLMMSVGREVEGLVTRLAQKARAAGIHLLLATQRPSVDVITGLIKANFPARISFQVTSRPDSRTILDSIGAERLLGDGDMLHLPPGSARLQRLHGAFVSDDEVRRVADFVKSQAEPEYQMEFLAEEEEEEPEGSTIDEPYDEMYDEAVQLVTESGQASISWVQRRLRVGYNRAARIVERMEQEGVVSSAEGGRPREVLARRIDSLDG